MGKLCPWIFAVVFFITAVCAAFESPPLEVKRFYGHQVYRVEANTEKQFQELVRLQAEDAALDFWTAPRLNDFTDIRVTPDNQELFKTLMETHGISYTVLIQDLEQVVEQERQDNERAKMKGKSVDDMERYYYHDEIQQFMEELARNYSELVTLETIGFSYEFREIKVARIGQGSRDDKIDIFMDCGFHAREWITPALCVHAMSQLAKNASQHQHLFENYRFTILPVVNPDGYEWTKINRMWRKTRSPNAGSACIGTDPNRNFRYEWGGAGSSANPCSDSYRGAVPFSEPETRAVRNLVESLNGNCAYFSFHSAGQLWMYPWGHTYHLPDDAEELHDVAQKGADALKAYNGTNYRVGSIYRVIYPASGVSVDWAKAEGGCKFSYTLELGDKEHGFFLPPHLIRPTCEETWMGLRAAFVAMQEYGSEIKK